MSYNAENQSLNVFSVLNSKQLFHELLFLQQDYKQLYHIMCNSVGTLYAGKFEKG